MEVGPPTLHCALLALGYARKVDETNYGKKPELPTFESASLHKLMTHNTASVDSNIITRDDGESGGGVGFLLQLVECPWEPIEVDRPVHCPSPQVPFHN